MWVTVPLLQSARDPAARNKQRGLWAPLSRFGVVFLLQYSHQFRTCLKAGIQVTYEWPMSRKTRKRRKPAAKLTSDPQVKVPEHRMIITILGFGFFMTVIMGSVAVFLQGDDRPAHWDVGYVLAKVIDLNDASSGTGVIYDVRVSIDRGPSQYEKIRYLEWTYFDVDIGLLDEQREFACLRKGRTQIPMIIVALEKCSGLRKPTESN